MLKTKVHRGRDKRTMKTLYSVLYLFITSLCISSCGYMFTGGRTILPPEVKKIAIPTVDNKTVESSLSRLLTDALRDEFEKYGAVQVVETENEADAVLNVTIDKVTREARTVTTNAQSDLQYDSTVTVTASLEKTSGGILWSKQGFAISREVGGAQGAVVTSSPFFRDGNFSSGDLSGQNTREVTRGQEKNVFDQISKEAARKIYDEAVAPDF